MTLLSGWFAGWLLWPALLVRLSESVDYFDTSLPVIKKGPEGTYFGYSVAQSRRPNLNSLIVGAPLGTLEWKSRRAKAGGVWTCPISTSRSDCKPLDNSGVEDPWQDNQWFGNLVRSQRFTNGTSGKIMVCSHRYLDENYEGVGRCYTYTEEFKLLSTWNKCRDVSQTDVNICQIGTSGVILDDDTVLLGAPGRSVWGGSAMSFSISNDFLTRQPFLYETERIQLKYSYGGMAVIADRLLPNEDVVVIVMGIPRLLQYGAVRLYRRNLTSLQEESKHYQQLDSPSFGSQFGYELATADINGDGAVDLLVGAPTDQKGGAVYIFLNGGTRMASDSKQASISCDCPGESRFGIAIANLGDLNGDGREEIAVGAPYAKHGLTEVGKVYIYAYKTTLVQVQEISGNQFGLTSFGHSLSGGLDMDGQGPSDLVVGAYLSDAVVLLRARPFLPVKLVIDPNGYLASVSSFRNACDDTSEKQVNCFKVELRLSLEGKQRQYVQNIRYTLKVDTNQTIRRVTFDAEHSSSEITGNFKFSEGNRTSTVLHRVYFTENARHIVTPIVFELNLIPRDVPKYIKSEGLASLADYPVFAEPVHHFQSRYNTELCGSNAICESSFQVEARVENVTEIQTGNLYVIRDSEKLIHLLISINNKGESSHDTGVEVEYNVTHVEYVGQDSTHTCKLSSNTVFCQMKENPLEMNMNETVGLKFKVMSGEGGIISRAINVTWSTASSIDKNKKQTEQPIIFNLLFIKTIKYPTVTANVEPTELMFTQESKEEMNVTSIFSFTVTNNVNSAIGNFTFNILWPVIKDSYNDLTWPIYTTAIDIHGTAKDNVHCQVPKEMSSTDFKPEKLTCGKKINDIFHDYLNCTVPSTQCLRINCIATNLKFEQKFVININASLCKPVWEDLDSSEIKLTLMTEMGMEAGIFEKAEDRPTDGEISLSVKIRNESKWSSTKIIFAFVGVIIGIILLGILIFTFYRIGFFIRNRPFAIPEETAHLEKADEEMLE